VAFLLAVLMSLAFAITNGFHDASNAIATLVATRVARPGSAVALAAAFNLLGPLVMGAAVAETVGALIDVPTDETVAVIGAGLTGAVVWNVATWARGLPASSSHSLVGGLVGAAILAEGAHAVEWRVVGLVLVALTLSPVLGFSVAAGLEALARRAMRRGTHRLRTPVARLQWVTSAWLAFSHGTNDAQKTVGVIVSLLVAHGTLSTPSAPLGVVLASSAALTIGTASGGWSIVRTIGSRIARLRPLDSLISQVSSASVILGASFLGAPVSTTQIVSSSVVGTGVGQGRRRHVRWRVVRDIAIASVTTLPAAAVIAALSLPVWRLIS
jgi:PiT family inorganic phosphate transporter